jgi:hypothetical protein
MLVMQCPLYGGVMTLGYSECLSMGIVNWNSIRLECKRNAILNFKCSLCLKKIAKKSAALSTCVLYSKVCKYAFLLVVIFQSIYAIMPCPSRSRQRMLHHLTLSLHIFCVLNSHAGCYTRSFAPRTSHSIFQNVLYSFSFRSSILSVDR